MGNTANIVTGISGLSFEDALKALEEIVRKLESGEVPLDESIDLYARGDALRAHCQARLDAAQTRIEAIVADRDGRPTGVRPFDDAGNSSGTLA
ncbi:MAG: exodeoxyribonuclease VII small subunit [Novosphingobium sp.]